jgi:hypothetical protein
MRDIPLQDIIAAHTDTSDTGQLEEFLPQLRFLRLRGSGPVTPEQLATALRLPRAEVEALFLSSGLVLGPDGNIHLPPGPHQFHLDGETFGGWCTLDTLLFLPKIAAPSRQELRTPLSASLGVSITVKPSCSSRLIWCRWSRSASS